MARSRRACRAKRRYRESPSRARRWSNRGSSALAGFAKLQCRVGDWQARVRSVGWLVGWLGWINGWAGECRGGEEEESLDVERIMELKSVRSDGEIDVGCTRAHRRSWMTISDRVHMYMYMYMYILPARAVGTVYNKMEGGRGSTLRASALRWWARLTVSIHSSLNPTAAASCRSLTHIAFLAARLLCCMYVCTVCA